MTPSCPRCGYDQSGEVARWQTECPLTSACSECGTTLDWSFVLMPDEPLHKRLFEAARRPWVGWFAQSMLAAAWPPVFRRLARPDDPLRPGRLAVIAFFGFLMMHTVVSALLLPLALTEPIFDAVFSTDEYFDEWVFAAIWPYALGGDSTVEWFFSPAVTGVALWFGFCLIAHQLGALLTRSGPGRFLPRSRIGAYSLAGLPLVLIPWTLGGLVNEALWDLSYTTLFNEDYLQWLDVARGIACAVAAGVWLDIWWRGGLQSAEGTRSSLLVHLLGMALSALAAFFLTLCIYAVMDWY